MTTFILTCWILGFTGALSLALSILTCYRTWRRSAGARTGGRLIIWPREPLEDPDVARIFQEWRHDDERLRAVMQLIQEHLETATGEILATEGTARDEAAGALAALEAFQREIVEKLKR